MKTATEALRELATRILKHKGLCTAAEAQILARAVLIKTGGVR